MNTNEDEQTTLEPLTPTDVGDILLTAVSPEDLVIHDQTGENSRNSQATEIVAFVTERFELFHDMNKEVFALDKKSNEVRHISGRQFHDFITANFYELTSKSVRDQALREALSTLSGIGRHHGECLSVHRRVAKHEGAYYVDLCQTGNSRAIKISPGAWEIIDEPAVRFARSETMQALPDPVIGKTLDQLWRVCNIPSEAQLLSTAWLAEALRPDTPFPILELVGEQGSAKSTTQTFLRRLIDPNSCDLRAAPKQAEDLFVSAGVNHIISYENISHLSAPMQDALCVVATGGGHAKRKLYTDADESVIYAKNPVIINGIAPVITAQDLIDRAITIELPVVTERTEINDLRFMFDKEHGLILGALMEVFAYALNLLPNVELPSGERPRLYEFARLGIAMAQAIGFTGTHFMQQFGEARQESITRTIEASPVALALIEWFDERGKVTIELATKNLFSEVEKYRPEGIDAWPKSAKGFSDALRRTAPALRQLGIECKCLGKQGSYVMWRIAPK